MVAAAIFLVPQAILTWFGFFYYGRNYASGKRTFFDVGMICVLSGLLFWMLSVIINGSEPASSVGQPRPLLEAVPVAVFIAVYIASSLGGGFLYERHLQKKQDKTKKEEKIHKIILVGQRTTIENSLDGKSVDKSYLLMETPLEDPTDTQRDPTLNQDCTVATVDDTSNSERINLFFYAQNPDIRRIRGAMTLSTTIEYGCNTRYFRGVYRFHRYNLSTKKLTPLSGTFTSAPHEPGEEPLGYTKRHIEEDLGNRTVTIRTETDILDSAPFRKNERLVVQIQISAGKIKDSGAGNYIALWHRVGCDDLRIDLSYDTEDPFRNISHVKFFNRELSPEEILKEHKKSNKKSRRKKHE